MRPSRSVLRTVAATVIVAAAAVAPGIARATVPASEGNLLTTCALDHTASDDPIKFPGVTGGSAHEHGFFGVKGIDAFTTTASLLNRPQTCNFAAENVGAWLPSMIWTDGTKHPASRIDIYYRKPVNTRAPVYPIPIGLRTIVGDSTNTTKPSAALWACGRGSFKSAIPPATCTAEVQESMYFPQCWNGKYHDAPDHHTLVGCTGAPNEIRLPQIQLTAHFPPGSGGGKLESDIDAGTSAGRTAHNDYWFAGDKRVWAKVIKRCLNAGIQCRVAGRETAWPPGSIVNTSVSPPKLVMTAAEAKPHATRRHPGRSRCRRGERHRRRACDRNREARPVLVHRLVPLGHVHP
jgi:uncharacterized protein DUF1996